jgi:L,D-peptidoglycan transpeptidase YkuD (ErfK/YbiS/YcfS/YnhG family)
MDLRVRPDSQLGGVLDWGAGARRCAVGRAGIAEKKEEGDGVTPIGRFAVRHVLYRADHLSRPKIALAVRMIMPGDGWCDAPTDPRYNQPVTLPYGASAEKLWREDALYDVVAVLGFNDAPVSPGKGSAIFLHVARADYAPTQGCVALALPDLLEALVQLAPGDAVEISR